MPIRGLRTHGHRWPPVDLRDPPAIRGLYARAVGCDRDARRLEGFSAPTGDARVPARGIPPPAHRHDPQITRKRPRPGSPRVRHHARRHRPPRRANRKRPGPAVGQCGLDGVRMACSTTSPREHADIEPATNALNGMSQLHAAATNSRTKPVTPTDPRSVMQLGGHFVGGVDRASGEQSGLRVFGEFGVRAGAGEQHGPGGGHLRDLGCGRGERFARE